MTHKVHPKTFRLGFSEDWNSIWFSPKKYRERLEEDFRIRKFLMKEFGKGVIEKIKIARSENKISITIKTARPGLLIGRGGEGIEILSKKLGKIVKGKEIKIDIEDIKEPSASASLLTQQIAQEIERRVPYKRAIKRAIGRTIRSRSVKGIKIKINGRLDGAEIARKETFREGKMPLQTLRANIDYGEARAQCTYGIVGLKVWIYKED